MRPMPNLTVVEPESWAEVRSHEQVMRYRRSGAGPSVLLLRSPGATRTLWPELGDALAARFRVIAPDVPPAGIGTARWLADFLEGLGLASVAVVAADVFCIPALELALLGGDQVSRLVLVPSGDADNAGLDGTLATPVRDESIALLVVRAGLPAGEALPLVVDFLAFGAVHSPG